MEQGRDREVYRIGVEEKSTGRSWQVDCHGRRWTVGRAKKNLVRLNGWRIAGLHAELLLKQDGVYLRDCSGGGATLVNGEPVSEYGPLNQRDRIGVGDFQLQLLIPGDDKGQEDVDGSVNGRPERMVEKELPAEIVPLSAGIVSPQFRAADPNELGEIQESRIEVSGKTDQGPIYLQPDWKRFRDLARSRLLAALDLRRLDVQAMEQDQLRNTISGLLDDIISELAPQLPPGMDREKLSRELLDETIGLGPLEELLADDTVSEIMVNGCQPIYVERSGRLVRTGSCFSSEEAIRGVIERIVSPLGRRIDESSPMVDARLEDGSRVNAVIPPLAVKGPCLTIRKFSKKTLHGDDLVRFGSLTPAMLKFIEVCVRYRKNIVVSGGTGSGKTTFLNVISSFIPHSERIITVEDSAELQLEQPHVVSLEGRPANIEGKGEVKIRDLVRNCLRMRPDRIVVGECRGEEALDMLQAMNTGHDGSLTTVHANSPRDMISRLEVMVMMAGMELPQQAIVEQIGSAVDVIVQQSRFVDGSRRITHISEITGVEGSVVQMQDIFAFRQQGFDKDGRVMGRYEATGRVPEFYEELHQRQVPVDLSIFNEGQV